MPFHPLPVSVRLGGWFQNQTRNIKICISPIFSITISIIFLGEILFLPIRWCFHEITHIYCDLDESEWSYEYRV